ncbi:hypothetical protein GGS21DRAFT_528863, partial [Xylaria nigripes]
MRELELAKMCVRVFVCPCRAYVCVYVCVCVCVCGMNYGRNHCYWFNLLLFCHDIIININIILSSIINHRLTREPLVKRNEEFIRPRRRKKKPLQTKSQKVIYSEHCFFFSLFFF